MTPYIILNMRYSKALLFFVVFSSFRQKDSFRIRSQTRRAYQKEPGKQKSFIYPVKAKQEGQSISVLSGITDALRRLQVERTEIPISAESKPAEMLVVVVTGDQVRASPGLPDEGWQDNHAAWSLVRAGHNIEQRRFVLKEDVPSKYSDQELESKCHADLQSAHVRHVLPIIMGNVCKTTQSVARWQFAHEARLDSRAYIMVQYVENHFTANPQFYKHFFVPMLRLGLGDTPDNVTEAELYLTTGENIEELEQQALTRPRTKHNCGPKFCANYTVRHARPLDPRKFFKRKVQISKREFLLQAIEYSFDVIVKAGMDATDFAFSNAHNVFVVPRGDKGFELLFFDYDSHVGHLADDLESFEGNVKWMAMRQLEPFWRVTEDNPKGNTDAAKEFIQQRYEAEVSAFRKTEEYCDSNSKAKADYDKRITTLLKVVKRETEIRTT